MEAASLAVLKTSSRHCAVSTPPLDASTKSETWGAAAPPRAPSCPPLGSLHRLGAAGRAAGASGTCHTSIGCRVKGDVRKCCGWQAEASTLDSTLAPAWQTPREASASSRFSSDAISAERCSRC
jgi:hypothetical protein